MKKRAFAAILCLLMLVGLLPTTALAADSLDFEVGNVTAPLVPGKEIQVPIVATANIGYGSGIMDYHWDNTALELINVTYSDTLAPPNGPAPLASTGTQRLAFGDYLKPDNYTGTGTFFTLTFKILDTAEIGDYAITLSDPDIIDAVTLENIPVNMTPGTVTLTEAPPKALSSIAITTPPTKTEYAEGESFDPAGMAVTATYDDGTTADVTASVTCTPAGALTAADTAVTVTYTEGGVTETATQTITVNPAAKVLESIAITTPPTKTEYAEGESFDPAGMAVTATYDDGTTADVTASVTCTPAGALTAADTAVTVTYTEGGVTETATQTITVNPAAKVLESIAITTPPTKTEYAEGESFDPAGMAVTATYDDGTTADVTASVTCTPAGALTAADTAVTLTYTEGGVTETVTLAITVKPAGGIYTISFDANGGLVIPASAVTGADGKLASLPTPTRSGMYSFSGWYTAVMDGTLVTANTVFTADTTIYAHWIYVGGGSVITYTLTFNTNGGSTIPSITRMPGANVQLDPYKPTREGYTFAGWYSDSALTQSITEVRLTYNMTVYAKWTKNIVNPFTDVKSTDYFYDAVLWAVENGVTNGTTATKFSPNMICTRAQMVTFLWRAAGSPSARGTMPFKDVARNAYYYDAVLWAWNNGVTLGTSATTFSPDMNVTRAQVVTLLYRYKGSPAVTGSIPFTDVPAGEWYYDAVRWATANEITQGTSATTFSPMDNCTRAQIVTFLYRTFK